MIKFNSFFISSLSPLFTNSNHENRTRLSPWDDAFSNFLEAFPCRSDAWAKCYFFVSLINQNGSKEMSCEGRAKNNWIFFRWNESFEHPQWICKLIVEIIAEWSCFRLSLFSARDFLQQTESANLSTSWNKRKQFPTTESYCKHRQSGSQVNKAKRKVGGSFPLPWVEFPFNYYLFPWKTVAIFNLMGPGGGLVKDWKITAVSISNITQIARETSCKTNFLVDITVIRTLPTRKRTKMGWFHLCILCCWLFTSRDFFPLFACHTYAKLEGFSISGTRWRSLEQMPLSIQWISGSCATINLRQCNPGRGFYWNCFFQFSFMSFLSLSMMIDI